MKCDARYIGPYGEMGYIYDTVYSIKVKTYKNLITVRAPDLPPKGYTSFSLMLREWDFSVEDWILSNTAEPIYAAT